MEEYEKWAQKFQRSGYCAKLKEVLKNSAPASCATSIIKAAIRSVAEQVGDYIYDRQNRAAVFRTKKSIARQISALAQSMLRLAKQVDKARNTNEIFRSRRSDQIVKASIEEPLSVSIPIRDLHGMQWFLEHYGKSWKWLSQDTQRRPPLDAEKHLVLELMVTWQEITQREADSSKKNYDRDGRLLFRHTARVVQQFINEAMGYAAFTDKNLDTAITAVLKKKPSIAQSSALLEQLKSNRQYGRLAIDGMK